MGWEGEARLGCKRRVLRVREEGWVAVVGGRGWRWMWDREMIGVSGGRFDIGTCLAKLPPASQESGDSALIHPPGAVGVVRGVGAATGSAEEGRGSAGRGIVPLLGAAGAGRDLGMTVLLAVPILLAPPAAQGFRLDLADIKG